MRFSVRWLLALVGYLAAALASVAYASQAWIDFLTVLCFLAAAFAATGAVLCRERLRGFLVGFAIFGAMAWTALFGDATAAIGIRTFVGAATDGIVQVLPNRQASIRRRLATIGRPVGEIDRVWIIRQDDAGDWEVAFTGADIQGIQRIVIPAAAIGGVPADDQVKTSLQIHLVILLALFGGFVGRRLARVASTGD